MNVLYISNLFPDRQDFNRGLFNARLVRHLVQFCNIRVISPRPGFLFWKTFTPCNEDMSTNPVYPVVPYVPIWGSRWNHILMAITLKRAFKNIYSEFKFDIALGSWIFPDCCAVARLAQEFKIPFVSTALGTDVHQYINNPTRRNIMLKELTHCSAIITVSNSLAQILRTAGFPENKIHTIYYGVEQNIFKPGDKSDARKKLNLPQTAPIILFVGNFLPIKDPLLTIESFNTFIKKYKLSNSLLILIGSGALNKKLKQKSSALGIANNIIFAGKKSPQDIAIYMQSADALCLTSINEGVPNVVLEALSTGLPVVATRVGGIPEIISDDNLGKLVSGRSPELIADSIYQIINNPLDKNRMINHSRRYDWNNTAQEYINLLEKSVAGFRSGK